MISNINSQYNPKFCAIQLSAKEAERAQTCIKQLADFNLDKKAKQILKNRMFDIFDKHIKEESAKRVYKVRCYKEVLSEMYLKFAELLDDIKNNFTLELFIRKLDDYKPSKDTLKGEYISTSLDAGVFRSCESIRKADLITSKDLPNPISAIEIENCRIRIGKAIEEGDLSPLIKERLHKRTEKMTHSDIAKEENINERSLTESLRKGTLRLQNKNGTIPKKYKDKIKTLAELLECSEEVMTKAVLKHTDLLSKRPETIMKTIQDTSKALGCTEKEFMHAALKQPTLLGMKTETVMQCIETAAKNFHCDKKTYIKMAVKTPALLYMNPETIMQNIRESSRNLGCTEEEFIKSGFRMPCVFYQKPETLIRNVKGATALLNCSVKDFTKLAFKYPQLFYYKPETLKMNIDKAVEAFGCSREDYIKAALKQSALLYQNTNTIIKNVATSAKLLNISDSKYIRLALRHPPLFSQKPETLRKNAEEMAKVLNMSVEEYIDRISCGPTYLSQKPETLIKKLKINHFYQKIKNEKPQNFLSQNSDERMYSVIMAFLIQNLNNSDYDCLTKVKRNFNLNLFIKAFADRKFSFEIPQDEVAEDFIKFAQEISMKTIGKNIFEFKITE